MWGRILRLAALLAIGLLCAASELSAEPNWSGGKPFRLEVITAAGGQVDVVARVLSNYLSASIGVPVIVEGRPGAGGNIAAAVVAKAQPDGHTLLVASTTPAVNPTLLPNPGFDYERDLAPVSMTVVTKVMLVAAPSFPAKDVTDVIKLAKQRPKAVSIAISPIGTPSHLGAEMLAQYGDIDLTFVPYDGIAQAIPDLIANRVNLAFANMSSLLPYVRSGELKALTVLSPQRSALAPDIPTSAEAGLPQMRIDAWICVMTTAGTPAPIIARLDDEIAKVLALPEVRDAFARQGMEIFHLNPQQLGAFIRSEAARFSGLLKHARAGAGSQ